MEELLEYRQRMLEQLVEAPRRLEKSLGEKDDLYQFLQPADWNAHQVIVHMRDVNQQVYLPRLARIVNEENPTFENFDGDAWMETHYMADEPAGKILKDFSNGCQNTFNIVKDLPSAGWNRPGTHPTLGKHTLQWWLERTLAHISEHLEQLENEGGGK